MINIVFMMFYWVFGKLVVMLLKSIVRKYIFWEVLPRINV